MSKLLVLKKSWKLRALVKYIRMALNTLLNHHGICMLYLYSSEPPYILYLGLCICVDHKIFVRKADFLLTETPPVKC